MSGKSQAHLLSKIQALQEKLDESEQLIDAIKAGEVDAFAINNSQNGSEIYTLQSGDYAYRVLIEQLHEGAINVTEDGLIVYANPYFLNLLKLSYDKVAGSSLAKFIHPGSIDEFNRLLKAANDGQSKGEINLQVNDSFIPVYISLTSLHPKLATIGIILTDLTEKKKTESIILEYQKDLELKNLRLVQNNEELASFAYIASHDLQEPLRKIQTFSTRILEKDYDSISDSGKDHFNRMRNAARRMQSLIEDLLAYSRTNTIERKFENTNLKKIVDDVKADLKEEIAQKEITIDVSEMCEVNVIPFQFKQLFNNLISNSIKFSHPGHGPHIEIKSEIAKGKKFNNIKLQNESKYCHISVVDNGIGFEQQYSEKIFELFQRLHGKSEYNGTGIGLAIVKKIIENHNGVITARSELNKGTTFDMYIPAK